MVQYRLTQKGKDALKYGDYLVQLVQDASRNGILTNDSLRKAGLDYTAIEADYIISVLSRMHFIEPIPVQDLAKGRHD